MDTEQLIQALKQCIKKYPLSAKYAVRVVEGIKERTSWDEIEIGVNYWATHIEVRDSITDDPTDGEIIIYSNE